MKKRVLIADDEAALLHTMAFSLRRKGFEVETALNGRMAFNCILQAAQNNTLFDLIITDIQMPDISGLELISKIRGAEFNTPILVITGYRKKNLLENLQEAGCTICLDKPFSMKELMGSITEILNNN